MIELLEKLDRLKKVIDQHPTIKEIEKVQKDIETNKDLYNKIIKKEKKTLEDEQIIKYKNLENEINFLILEINQYLKENLLKNSRCQNESD